MNAASRSIVPWFTHRRMLPKWAGLVATGAVTFLVPASAKLILFLVGVLIFFPTEYLVHRGVFHGLANKPIGKVLSRQHIAHHETPDDLNFLFNDPRISVSVGLLYFLVYLAVTRDLGQAGALSFGNFAALLYYEHVHFSAHRPAARPWTPWSRYLKKWHLWHHFKNEHHWFGVTSPVFDWALGTAADPKAVEASPTVRTLVPRADEVEWMRAEAGAPAGQDAK